MLNGSRERLQREALCAVALLAALSQPLLALSTSASFSNTASSLNSGGESQASTSFSHNSTAGELGQTTAAGSSFLVRSGLIPVYFYPGRIAWVFTSSGTATGEVALFWNAPGNDAYAAGTSAGSYVVKYTSVAAQNPALSEALFAAAPGATPAPPAPAGQGTLQSATLQGLEPAVTYYFAIRARERDGLGGVISAGAIQRAPGIAAITDLFVSTGPGVTDVTLSWTVPDHFGTVPALTYAIKASSQANINNNGQFNLAQPLSDFSQTAAPAFGAVGSKQNLVVTGLIPCRVHYFAIRASDSGAGPAQKQALWLRSIPLGWNVYNYSDVSNFKPPMVPMSIEISTTSTSATLSWAPVTSNMLGVPFANPSQAAPGELTGYQVYRATAPTNSTWTSMVSLSSTTLAYTDGTSGSQYYYYVRGENICGPSAASLIRAHDTENLWVVAYDSASTLEIPRQWSTALQGYHVTTEARPEELSGTVVKSFDIKAMRDGIQWDPSKKLDGLAKLKIHFTQNGAFVGTSGAPLSGVTPTPDNTSIFWYNGNKWVQLYGKTDMLTQTVSIDTPYMGQFQLRVTERASATLFDTPQLSNRLLTPNGDGKNDAFEIKFDNPRAEEVAGRIYDLKGGFVANMDNCPDNPVEICRRWDGKAGGAAVPGGVYFYQVEGGGKIYNGTVVVVK